MRSMIQVDTSENVLSESIHRFHFQKSKCSPDNPWFNTVESYMATQCHVSLMKRLNGRSHVINKFTWEVQLILPGQQMNFKTFWKQWRLTRLENAPGVLHHYILSRCRNGPCGIDSTIVHRNHEERKIMIYWRRNLLFSRKKCPICYVEFNRGLINDCLLVQNCIADILTENFTVNMFDDHQELLSNSIDRNFKYNGHYNLLNTLLNNKQHSEFTKIVNQINENMPLRSLEITSNAAEGLTPNIIPQV